MGDVVNLNHFRKRRERLAAARRAAANRTRSGLTRRERDERLDAERRQRRELDGKRLDPGDD